jgi:hypothetical protein
MSYASPPQMTVSHNIRIQLITPKDLITVCSIQIRFSTSTGGSPLTLADR